MTRLGFGFGIGKQFRFAWPILIEFGADPWFLDLFR